MALRRNRAKQDCKLVSKSLTRKSRMVVVVVRVLCLLVCVCALLTHGARTIYGLWRLCGSKHGWED